MSQNGPWGIVVGSSSGIGRATAEVLAQAGWNLLVHYRRNETGARETVRQVEKLGRSADLLQADLSDAGQAESLVVEAWNRAGRIDAWVHLAGADLLTGPTSRDPFEVKLKRIIDVDLVGTILACRAAGAKMREQGAGCIVTMGWDQSATGMSGDSGEMFAAVKGGIAAFSRSLAKSLAPEVRVNCVAPGWIKTAWGDHASAYWQERARAESPLGRWGTPADVARAIEFLVSPRASFVTGQTINVGGGAVTS